MSFTVRTEISATPADAFDRMADPRNETRWNSRVSSSELLSDEPVRAGSLFRTVNRGKEYDATISTYERPERLVFAVTGKPMDITATFTFGDGGGAMTAFMGEFDMRPKGFLKAIFPLLRPAIGRDLAKQSQSFKAFCEDP